MGFLSQASYSVVGAFTHLLSEGGILTGNHDDWRQQQGKTPDKKQGQGTMIFSSS
jgi:hypothetical protein